MKHERKRRKKNEGEQNGLKRMIRSRRGCRRKGGEDGKENEENMKENEYNEKNEGKRMRKRWGRQRRGGVEEDLGLLLLFLSPMY